MWPVGERWNRTYIEELVAKMSLEDLKDACTRAALSINLQSLSKMELRSDDNNKFCNV